MRWKQKLNIKINTVIVLVVSIILIMFGAYGILQTRSKIIEDLYLSRSLTSERLAKTLVLPVWNVKEKEIEASVQAEMRDVNVYAVIVRDAITGNIMVGKIRDQEWSLRDIEPLEPVTSFLQQQLPIVMDDKKLGSVDGSRAPCRFDAPRLTPRALRPAPRAPHPALRAPRPTPHAPRPALRAPRLTPRTPHTAPRAGGATM